MSILNPDIDFSDSDIRKLMDTDFDYGLRMTVTNIEIRLKQFVGQSFEEHPIQQITNLVQELFFEFVVHWNLEYQICCLPIADPTSFEPKYVIMISFTKPCSVECQTIKIHVNP